MRILILANYANGLFLFRKELLKSFLDAGHEVLISVPSDENCVKLKNYCTKIIETPLERHGMNPARDYGLFRFYGKMLKTEKPDVVLTYTIKPNIYGALACRLGKVPYICNITGLGMAIENGGLMSKVLLQLYRISTGKAQRVFFQNERNRKFIQMHGIARKNSGLLPGSGVNLTEHTFHDYPSEAEGIHFLAVIRMMRDKGIEEYLSAAKSITSEYNNVYFDLVGEYEEDERAKYEPMIMELENAGKLKYYGHLDSVDPVFEKCHVVVHPSYHEGMSNVLLEAAACGRPILCSNIHGCIEAIEDGKTGFTFESKSAESLIGAVKRILALNENERADMGRRGREYIEKNFDRQLVINAYKEELEKIRTK
ncbi:glycosyltransferase family 4 protein [Butyrivibrio sp. AC2005]|uniref:glycosyltransferase family 4 protein n=1 Tax=Butyrivibrio sp. AC2005 TaxID=1280672 RepID=UPI00047D1C29|nr:glycosyltransferase family 4 protein [Butyrivibrio sp. AC2005]